MSQELKIILLVSSLVVLTLVLFICIYFPLKNKRAKKDFKEYCGSLVYKIATYGDYYLINELELPLGGDICMHIDHLLFGDKFIYLICDRYYDGALEGDENNQSLTLNYKNGTKKLVDNPLIINSIRADKLTLVTQYQIPRKFIVSIVVVNDDALILPIKTSSPNNKIVQYSKLHKLIKAIENRDVAKIDTKNLEYAVKDIARMNEKIK